MLSCTVVERNDRRRSTVAVICETGVATIDEGELTDRWGWTDTPNSLADVTTA